MTNPKSNNHASTVIYFGYISEIMKTKIQEAIRERAEKMSRNNSLSH